jgi:hypothetical protein
MDNRIDHRGERLPFDEISLEERKRMGLYTSMGFAWEDVIRQALAGVWLPELFGNGLLPEQIARRWRSIGTLWLDGIAGTPDWFDSHDEVLEEFKATWTSSRRDLLNDHWTWITQIKCYCHMLQIHKARLWVYFVAGDYRGSGPQIKPWSMTFSPRELDENWRMIRNNATAKQLEEKKNGKS